MPIVGGAMIVPADGAEGVLLKAAGGGTGTFELGAGAQRSADEASPLPVLEGRLYFLCTAKAPTSVSGTFFLTVSRLSRREPARCHVAWRCRRAVCMSVPDLSMQFNPVPYACQLNEKLRYLPFCSDFGPYNLSATHFVYKALAKLLTHPSTASTTIVFYSSHDATDVTNSVYILGAFLVLFFGATPEQALQPFAGLVGQTVPFRDATWVPSTFDLSLRDCWAGLKRAVATGLYTPATFDFEEYLYYDEPANGDLHQVVAGKFIAFKGPKSRAVGSVDPGCHSMAPCMYLQVFRAMNVSAVVQLNSPEYRAADFTDEGITHYDLSFKDCSTPSDGIVDR